MPICVICKTIYYRESEIDPAEPCYCGDMANGPLWDWGRWRAYRWWLWYLLWRRWLRFRWGVVLTNG